MIKKNDLLLILGSGAILVIIWVIFSIYHNSVSSTINETTAVQLTPIKPNFDNIGIRKIKDRTDVSPLYSIQGTPSPSSEALSNVSNNTATESGATP